MNENTLTIKQLFFTLGYDFLTMEINKPIDVSHLGYQIKSLKNDSITWSSINKIIRKEQTDAYHVPQFNLDVSPLHLFYAKVANSEPHWLEATALIDCNDVELLHETQGWTPVNVEWHKDRKIEILDLEVEGTHSYFSNGLLSHNTLHGDPHVTPGGRAIPFHSSVRIRLGSGSQVKDKAGNVIGIHTTLTVKKNKVALPFRKCEFDIHFGKGIVESEFLFDEVRAWCDEHKHAVVNGKQISVTGSGAWKELKIVDDATGEVLSEKKFYKSEFGELWSSKDFGPALHDLAEKVFVVDISNYDPNELTTGEELDETG